MVSGGREAGSVARCGGVLLVLRALLLVSALLLLRRVPLQEEEACEAGAGPGGAGPAGAGAGVSARAVAAESGERAAKSSRRAQTQLAAHRQKALPQPRAAARLPRPPAAAAAAAAGGLKAGGRGGASRGRGGPPRGPARGPPRGPRGGGKAAVAPHPRFEGVFVAKGRADALATKNLVPGESVYGEKRLEAAADAREKSEFRVWNPFRSKLGAALAGGVAHMPIRPGAKVLYLGAANGTTVSHVSDIVGPEGAVFAVEFSARAGRDLTALAKKRSNVVPILEDARQPLKYRMLVDAVDVVFADVAQPDQARILALNAALFLRAGGWFLLAVKASCVDSTARPEAVFAAEVDRLRRERCRPREQLTLEPYHRDHAVVIGQYRVAPKK